MTHHYRLSCGALAVPYVVTNYGAVRCSAILRSPSDSGRCYCSGVSWVASWNGHDIGALSSLGL
eukprot:5351398-Pyramimonas_sp.AAC.1